MSFREDIKRPFNLLTIAIAIVGTIGTFYFYYFPRNERQIAYTTSQASLIYDSSVKSPNISLVDSADHKITANTYLMNFTLWNSGRQPIEPSDVRRPITINFPGVERILDYKITTSVDQEVSGFSLSIVTNDPSMKALQIHWNHFDPNHGLSFQVIYSQSSISNLFVTSDIVGLHGLIRGEQGVKDEKAWHWLLKIISPLIIVSYIAFYSGVRDFRKRDWFGFGLGVLVCVFMIIMIIAQIQSAVAPRPPF